MQTNIGQEGYSISGTQSQFHNVPTIGNLSPGSAQTYLGLHEPLYPGLDNNIPAKSPKYYRAQSIIILHRRTVILHEPTWWKTHTSTNHHNVLMD